MAREGKLDPVIGRDKEIERVIQILVRRRKNNPVLLGDPGVGKTAIVEGLAQRLANRQVPDPLLNKRVVARLRDEELRLRAKLENLKAKWKQEMSANRPKVTEEDPFSGGC